MFFKHIRTALPLRAHVTSSLRHHFLSELVGCALSGRHALSVWVSVVLARTC